MRDDEVKILEEKMKKSLTRTRVRTSGKWRSNNMKKFMIWGRRWINHKEEEEKVKMWSLGTKR